MAGAAQDRHGMISNLSGDTFSLSSGNEADLKNFVQCNRRTSPSTVYVLDASMSLLLHHALLSRRTCRLAQRHIATNYICLPLNVLTFIRRMSLLTGRVLLISIREFLLTLMPSFKRFKHKVSRPKRSAVCNASRQEICFFIAVSQLMMKTGN